MDDIMEFANREAFRKWLNASKSRLLAYPHSWRSMSLPARIFRRCPYLSRKPIRGHILTQKQMSDGKNGSLGWWIGSIEI